MKRWLITAFEPFAGAKSNSSQLLLEKIKSRNRWGDQLRFADNLPVTFAGAWPALLSYSLSDVDGVLSLGQAEGRTLLSLEHVALNWIDANSPDNSGARIQRQRVNPNGPDVYWSTIAWEKMTLPEKTNVSYSAGVFVCNQVMYHLMHWANENQKIAGFIHVPLLASQTDPEFVGRPRLDDAVAEQSFGKILDFLVGI